MIDLKTLDGDPSEVAAAAINNAEEALVSFIRAAHEAERYVSNAARTEILSVDPDMDAATLATQIDRSTERGHINAILHHAIDLTRAIQALRKLVSRYEGYGE
jgi:3-keto-L-gulonate-6-phosphate decarboxylase